MDKKEQWTDEVLNSLDGIQSAVPDEDVWLRIAAHLPKPKSTLTTIMPRWQLRWAAVAAGVLVALNWYVLEANLNTQQSGSITAESENVKLFVDYSLYQ